MTASTDKILRRATDTTKDLQEIRTVIAHAFFDDPFTAWMFPIPETRKHCLAVLFGTMVEWYLQHGRVEVIEVGGSIAAAAVWDFSRSEPTETGLLPSAEGLVEALLGKERTDQVMEAYGCFVSTRPQGPYAYLHFLAVSPDRQRKGLGRQVIQPGLDHGSELSLPLHLKTNNPDNLAFYQSLGFTLTAQQLLPHNGPTLYALSRSN